MCKLTLKTPVNSGVFFCDLVAGASTKRSSWATTTTAAKPPQQLDLFAPKRAARTIAGRVKFFPGSRRAVAATKSDAIRQSKPAAAPDDPVPFDDPLPDFEAQT